jgi:hypothetical protein
MALKCNELFRGYKDGRKDTLSGNHLSVLRGKDVHPQRHNTIQILDTRKHFGY